MTRGSASAACARRSRTSASRCCFRGSNAVGYSNYPDNVVAGFVKHAADSGMDIFRIFDSLNYLPNMQVAMEAARDHGKVLCEAAICYTGDILDAKRDKYSLKYYVDKAKELEQHGRAHPRHQGHGRPCKPLRRATSSFTRAQGRRSASPSTSTPTTPPASTPPRCSPPADAGVDIVDLAIASHVRLHLAAEPQLHRRRPRQHRARSRPRLRLAQRILRLLGGGARASTSPSTPRRAPAPPRSTEHEMPGGQYTNLREQANAMGLGHRWREIARTYAEVNQLFGDIVKVTPSLQGRRRHVHVPRHPRHQGGRRARS